MAFVEEKKDTDSQCWARLRLESGDRIFISVAASGVDIFKLKWFGLIPGIKLWGSQSVVQAGRMFFDVHDIQSRPIDQVIEKVVHCKDIVEICTTLHSLENKIYSGRSP